MHINTYIYIRFMYKIYICLYISYAYIRCKDMYDIHKIHVPLRFIHISLFRYNLIPETSCFKVYNSMAFSVFIELYVLCHCLILFICFILVFTFERKCRILVLLYLAHFA
jgi:hypothetical protein